jgi:signal transduction histidine kinase/ActR/RegA family two-component response regulator
LKAQRALVRYGAAVGAAAVAAGLRLVLAPLLGSQLAFVTFIAGGLFAAWYGGIGPGILASALGGALAVGLFHPRPHPDLAFTLGGYAFVCLLCIGFVEWNRRNHERFARTEALGRMSLEVALAGRKELEEALRARLDELGMVNRRKSEFLAALAHELRNPLAPVSNAIEVLERDPDEPTRARMLGILRHQAARLAHVVDDLIDVSRIEQGKVDLRMEVLDFADPVRHAIAACESAFGAAHPSLSADFPVTPVWVKGDAGRLEQIALNLLQNALKYTPSDGHVWVRLVEGGGEAALRVRDDGFGIPRDLLERIFDLFTQAPQPLARTQGGLGIGLSIVRTLVERHGGSVSAASQGPGLGSEFVVRLPLSEPPERKESSAPEPARPVTRPLRVLVIEDNADMRDSMRDLLRMWGHVSQGAADGLEGLAQTLLFKPDVGLVDLGLPRMDGYEVARQIRGQEGGRDVLLIALSGYGQPADVEAARAAGFDQHIVKPPDLVELEKLLAREASRRVHDPGRGPFSSGVR